jgi:hypothetical protein
MPSDTLTHRIRVAVVLAASTALTAPAWATNWIMLQGTEPASAPAYKAFGFVGIDYQQTGGTELPAGLWQGQPMVLNQIPPRLEADSALQISHVRLGLRGRLLDGRLNYWVSPLAGDNPISSNGTPNVKFTDLSLTLNQIPHARIRIGQFFFPGSEEGLQPVVLRDYINPTSVGSQIVNELPFDSDGLPRDAANEPTGPASGWRDTGIQVFDAFKTGHWEHTYALMAGTGTGLALYNGAGSGRPDWHLYWSSEWVFSGMGPFREGFKLFAWYLDGDRKIRAGLKQTEQAFDRERAGLGATFRRGPWRAAAEWIQADGMIFNGTDGVAVPGAVSNNGKWVASYDLLPEEEADGWYLDGGYTLFDKLELRARYDRLNRGTGSVQNERRFDTLTLGVTYRFSQQVRVLADYQIRDFEAPGLSGTSVPNQILEGVDDLAGVRLWASF